ncbi:unnamed protein product [Eruca vesicaria subsp. sativa]|uniref:Uncharacterized protein n=1 Tax=Eruca vesicaria subsp. sativa TaxID=29727 RepID=A0ABC8JAW8_ERUVS|nr:unnamed protein product [Eruca vesicaria subsp. sativa]
MLVESSFSASVKTSLLNTSEYQHPFAAFNWMSLTETYQMIHKLPDQSQVSFLEAVPVPDAVNLDELSCPEKTVIHKVSELSCPEQTGMHNVSEKALTSLVYSRRKWSMRPGGTEDNSPGKCNKQEVSLDGSVVPVYNHEESIKGKHRFNNCLVYSRKKRGKISYVTGETTLRADGIDDAFVSGHDCGEAKRRRTRLDECLVYTSRKEGGVTSNGCSFSEHVSRGTKIGCDQADSSEYIQVEHIVKAGGGFTGANPGEISNSSHRPVCSQSKQLVKSNGLLVYSRRQQRGKYNGAPVYGFLVYKRKKPSVDNTQATEVTSSSEGTNDRCSSQSSSELASGPSKTGESEAADSGSDTDSSSPFKQCKRCDKAGNVDKMLICDECEEAYHTRCCGVRMKEVAQIDDWFCRSCLEKKPSKTNFKGRSRERKWRVSEPFVIGIRVGKEFQADVPDWSGPTMSDSTSFVGEPLEIDHSKYMHDLKNGKKPGSAVNWLQCREEDRNGDICGKWRRAPRSEVQTNDWECFCCVSWDPSHADCAVPQELETDEILKQLKYINMLRPRSDAKTRKIGPDGRSRLYK